MWLMVACTQKPNITTCCMLQQWKNAPLRFTLQNIEILKNEKDNEKGEISWLMNKLLLISD